MSSQGIPKINELPLSQDFIPGDKIIIDRDSKAYLVDYDNLFVKTNQISFQQDITNDTNGVDNLQQYSTDKYNELVTELTEKSIGRSTAHLIDITNTTSEGTLSSASYREFITSTDTPFIGPNNLVVFDNSLVDKLSLSVDGVKTESTECDVDRVVFGQGTISVPKGTYRVRASISLSPEVNIDLDQKTLDEFIRRKQQVWSYLSFVQLTNPERIILNGSGSSTYNNIGQSITLTLNGYFYTDKTKQYGLKVHTLGKLYPGVVTGTYTQNTDSGVLDKNYLSISDLFGREQFNQSRIIIERISETDTLAPLEDSPQGFRSQALAPQPRVPLIYNAGWLQRIAAQDTSVIPASSLFVITHLPFIKNGVDYLGDARGYITEPKSYQGYIKIGDTVKYRKQQRDSQGILPKIFYRYDIRDKDLITPDPGWYGLIVDETTKKVGEQYDTIFRVDINGVVSQRQYITEPGIYYPKCSVITVPDDPGSTPPPPTTTRRPTTSTTRGPGDPDDPTTTTTSTTTTTTTTTTIKPPTPKLQFGEIIAVGGVQKEYIIPDNIKFIHAVCIGGGQGGFKSFYDQTKNDPYDPGRAGDGGDLSYLNHIPVRPGDKIVLKSGRGGQGKRYDNKDDRKGEDSELSLIRNDVTYLLLIAAGGGRSVNRLSRFYYTGGKGSSNVLLNLPTRGAVKLGEYTGAGGGAGGYGGEGGNGGQATKTFKQTRAGRVPVLTDAKGENGKGGGGGGGGSDQNDSGPGGGAGYDGHPRSGVDNGGGGAPGAPGQAGSQGTGKQYGGGGRSVYYAVDNVDLMDGGPGAVRIIWGDGYSYPNDARK